MNIRKQVLWLAGSRAVRVARRARQHHRYHGRSPRHASLHQDQSLQDAGLGKDDASFSRRVRAAGMMPGKPFPFLTLVLCAWFSGRTATWLLPEFTRGVGVTLADPLYRQLRSDAPIHRGPLMPPRKSVVLGQ